MRLIKRHYCDIIFEKENVENFGYYSHSNRFSNSHLRSYSIGDVTNIGYEIDKTNIIFWI